MSPFRHFVSACSLIYGLMNLTFWCVPLFVLTLIRLAAPSTRPALKGATDAIYRAAVRLNDLWFRHVLGYRWQHGIEDLDPDATYLVIANHQSWADSFIIQSAIVQHGPVLKVLVKEELMRFPILAMIFWAYDFPRLKRRARSTEDEPERRRQDAERIRDASRQLLESPGAILVYPEGTRFTEEKHAAQGSGFQHLLKPRPGGFATMVGTLRNEGRAVIDLSIRYPESSRFWRFLSGAMDEPAMRVDIHPISEIGDDPSAWLEQRWQAKEEWLAERRAPPAG